MNTIDQTADFANCQPGPAGQFTAAAKRRAWKNLGVSYDADPDGLFFSIMPNGGPKGEACCRMIFRPGLVGATFQSYQVNLGRLDGIYSVEADWLFETGFDYVGGCQQGHNGGKLGPCLQLGPISGAAGGLRAMWWWQTNPSNCQPGTVKMANPVVQDQQSKPPGSNELIQPPKYVNDLRIGAWRHIKISGRPGPKGHGFLQHEFNGTVANRYEGDMRNSKIGDLVLADFASFAGGGSAEFDSPKRISYARQANVRLTFTPAG